MRASKRSIEAFTHISGTILRPETHNRRYANRRYEKIHSYWKTLKLETVTTLLKEGDRCISPTLRGIYFSNIQPHLSHRRKYVACRW